MSRRDQDTVTDRLRSILARRILVLDGAMGTVLQGKNLTAADFGGPELEGCNEHLNLTRPDVVTSVYTAYLDVGAGIIETNTFSGTPIVLAEYGLQDLTAEINREGARLARLAADSRSTPDKPRFVAGSMGPTTKTITVTCGATFDQLRQARGGRQRRRAGEAGHPRAAVGLGHDRADGHDARRSRGGRAVSLARTRRSLLDRPQLRDRPRIHDRPPPLARRPGDVLRLGLSQRGAPRRGGMLRRDAADAGRQAVALRR